MKFSINCAMAKQVVVLVLGFNLFNFVFWGKTWWDAKTKTLSVTSKRVIANSQILSTTSCTGVLEGKYPLYKSFPPMNIAILSYFPFGCMKFCTCFTPAPGRDRMLISG